MPKKNPKETVWCPHCGADVNHDCWVGLVRCTNTECGRYTIR